MTIQIHKTVQAFRSLRRTIPHGKSIGFVPTMGALHAGHLSLVREARDRNDIVVASIYVNPTQFGPNEDLDKYPRQMESDKKCLEELGVDHLFCPTEMYSKIHRCYVDPVGFDNMREGSARPGHFRGVATIVNKLLNIVQPTRAYFGQKDAAQCVLIKRLVADMDLDVEVNVMDTVREEDGLAMSSRNAYLTDEERGAAVIIHKSLCAAREIFEGSFAGNLPMDANIISETVISTLETEPLVKEIEYVAVDSKETMEPITEIGPEGAVLSLAVKIGKVRLIDNFIL
jgi:pantoate--beta-alanine ligase